MSGMISPEFEIFDPPEELLPLSKPSFARLVRSPSDSRTFEFPLEEFKTALRFREGVNGLPAPTKRDPVSVRRPGLLTGGFGETGTEFQRMMKRGIRDLTESEAEGFLTKSVAQARRRAATQFRTLNNLKDFSTLTPAAQLVSADIAFSSTGGLRPFKGFRKAVLRGDNFRAAQELLFRNPDSDNTITPLFAQQKSRVLKNARILLRVPPRTSDAELLARLKPRSGMAIKLPEGKFFRSLGDQP